MPLRRHRQPKFTLREIDNPKNYEHQRLGRLASTFGKIIIKTLKKLPSKLQIWIDARNKYRLSHAQIQMARELGLNPKKFGSLANNKQESWKSPLPDFIEEIYYKNFKKDKPDQVLTIEEIHQKKREKREKKSIDISIDDEPIENPF